MQNGHLSDAEIHNNVDTVSGTQLNGHSPPHVSTPQVSAETADALKTEISHDALLNGTASVPRGRKRKLTDTESPARFRAVSPPWKRIEADGPTSFIEDGRRKSSRTNNVPLEFQPPADTRTTRRALHKTYHKKSRHSLPSTSRRTDLGSHGRPLSAHGAAKPKASPPIASRPKDTPTRGRPRRVDRLTETSQSIASAKKTDNQVPSAQDEQPKPVKRGPGRPRKHPLPDAIALQKQVPKVPRIKSPQVRRLRLNYRAPPMPILHPGNIPRQKQHTSLEQWLAQDIALEGEDVLRLTSEEIKAEAAIRDEITNATKTGGVLSDGVWPGPEMADLEEPILQHTHQDYLLKHVENFQPLLQRETIRHMAQAKRIAHLALAAWKIRQPKSLEELIREQNKRFEASYRVLVKDLDSQWKKIEEVETRKKLKQYEENEAALGKKALNDMLEHSSQLLVKRRELAVNGPISNDDDQSEASIDTGSKAGSDSSDSASDDDGDDDDMTSSSGSEDDDNASLKAEDELSREELLAKYANLPEISLEADGSTTESDDYDDDDEDEDEDEDESGQSDGSGSESDDGSVIDDADVFGNSIYGFLTKKEIAEAQETAADFSTQDAMSVDEADTKDQTPDKAQISVEEVKNSQAPSSPRELILEPTSASDEPSAHASYDSNALEKASSVSSVEPQKENGVVDPEAVKTKVPELLRGTLREYQHYGLDWLANMYANNTNGILADEMGLGKTIQTISLLAHLATHWHIWGPHLVVVPTSVMLNWEMEFKKFLPGFKILTYYGTQEERKAKRKGWLDDDRWNVCITSYQLALQDATSLKRRKWHYMILDEAHNIKNYRSQRWQTLRNFPSQRRLLLTGTPLQNNLGELWSLLFFLSHEEDKFGDLHDFSRAFRGPAEQILDHGREALDPEAREIVQKLHKVLRPHLLRRLKADVEKQMPKKYEHVVRCRLSKRQRQLYDGYMGLSGTRQSFASGNYMSIINCLMQLRKVCNHPDLFETRQIVTSFAMPRSAVADFEIKELLVRRKLFDDDYPLGSRTSLENLWGPNRSTFDVLQSEVLAAVAPLGMFAERQYRRLEYSEGTASNSFHASLADLELRARQSRLEELQSQMILTSSRVRRRPIYSSTFLKQLSISRVHSLQPSAAHIGTLTDKYLNTSTALDDMVLSVPQRSEEMTLHLHKFACVTPAVTAPDMTRFALTNKGVQTVEQIRQDNSSDSFHDARVRLSIAFPDKSLIQYDCGKLQQLARLLRDLQAGGHRALIFTQMTKVLDILEQFLNLHGHRYLRLDGATKIEQRQVLTDRFNNDPRILVFILSSRSGGLGINLTGADTVIFYDLDWNPAMDKQCQDRCHRIGQTRDVHIYRFVSEGTIESNILRKSNQKRLLDDVVIQDGDFTTDYFNRMSYKNFLDEDQGDAEADAALDKILGGNDHRAEQDLGQVEDQEDRDAAKVAEKEDVHADDVDFNEKADAAADAAKAEQPPTPQNDETVQPKEQEDTQAMPSGQIEQPNVDTPMNGEEDAEEEEEPKTVLDYMARHMEWEYREVVIVPPSERKRKKAKKGKDHGIRIRR